MIRHTDTMESKTEFLEFLQGFQLDLRQNPDNWENPTLEGFLDALAAWVRASDNYYRNNDQPVPANVNWQYFAHALMAARIYE